MDPSLGTEGERKALLEIRELAPDVDIRALVNGTRLSETADSVRFAMLVERMKEGYRHRGEDGAQGAYETFGPRESLGTLEKLLKVIRFEKPALPVQTERASRDRAEAFVSARDLAADALR